MRAPIAFAAASLVLFACDRGPAPSGSSEPYEAPPAAAPAPAPAAAAPAPVAAPAPAAAPAFDPAHPRVGGVAFEVPAPFVYRAPGNAMRAAEYVLAADGAEAVLVVHHFPGMGGSPEANITRWIDQVSQPDGRSSREVAKVEKATVGGLEITRVDLTGVFADVTPTGGAAAPVGGQRLLGAVVVGPEGPVFFKLVGPTALVGTGEAAFTALLESSKVAAQ